MTELEEISGRLEHFFAKRLPGARNIKVSDCERLVGGWANITIRFTLTVDGEARRYVTRSGALEGQGIDTTDRMKEWRLLSGLTRLGTVPMPKALYADEDGSELGSPTIVLEYAEGGAFVSQIRASEAEERPAQAHMLANLAANIHATDLAALPAELEQPDDWNAYIDGLIAAWRQAEGELSDSLPILRYIAAWLDTNRPPPTPMTLVHGDFHPGNQVFDAQGRLLAIDWEFAHVGDPREDIGWCKYVEAVQPPSLIGRDVEAFCKHYRERSGLSQEIVNPLTLDYFSILPAIKVMLYSLKQQQAAVEGRIPMFQPGYMVGAIVTAYETWFNAAKRVGV